MFVEKTPFAVYVPRPSDAGRLLDAQAFSDFEKIETGEDGFIIPPR